MKTPYTQSESNQTIPQAQINHRGLFTTALGALLLFVAMAVPALAEDLEFHDDQSADSMTFTNDFGLTIGFFDSSTAATATIMNVNSGSGGGMTNFRDASKAGNARITNDGAGTSTNFFDNSTAENATIINSNSGTGFGAGAGRTNFRDASSAANATITNEGATTFTRFLDTSKGGNATITNSGNGSGTTFEDGSPGPPSLPGATAANATVTNSGSNSFTAFVNNASGGNAALINANSTAFIEISLLNGPGTTVGSIAGSGTIFLGSNNLTVGGNLQNTVFSGVISDGGSADPGFLSFFDLNGPSTDTGGSLTKVGTGMLTLTGKNTYTGPTIIDAGSLLVDESISSAQTLVNSGGLLGGIGVIGGSVVNSGIVSPGDSPGTLTVAGGYTQTASGTLRIEVAGTAQGQFDLLAVGGHASLAGTLQLIGLGNFRLQVGDKITFLTAGGGVSGTFGTVQNLFDSNTLVKAEINILANAVQLEGTQGSFTEVACNPNALAVAKALDSAAGDPRAAGLIDFLDTQPLSELCHDLNLISPEELAAIFNIGISLANIQDTNLERRMDDIHAGSSGFSAKGFSINTRGRDLNLGLAGPSGPEGKSGPSVMQPIPENRWGVFVTGIGEFTDVDNTDNASGFYLSTGGVTFGVDYRLSPNFAIGMMGGYAHTNGDLVDGGRLDVDGGKIGAYATAFSGGFYVNAAATGGFNDYDTRRTALLGTASGDTEGREFTGLISAGYDWKTGNLTVGPIASYQYTYVDFDGFTEHGSLAPLTFGDQSAESNRTALGAKASYDWHVGHVLVRPEVRATWQHEFGDRDYSIVSSFANGAGNSFTVTGPAIGRDSLLLGAGVAVLFNDRVSMYAYYDGELARTNYSSNNVTAGLRFTF
jgi:outer membrane autotransporter protein